MRLPLPKVYLAEQRFKDAMTANIEKDINDELNRLNVSQKIKPDQTVAITAGSRGIHNMNKILKTLVDYLKGLGARPFIIPAMGSHGGGTAEGQRQLIADYGITESEMGCEIVSSMETKIIGQSRLNTPVFIDKQASEADHIVVVNRVKPHTKLIGSVESGLLKMCLIGLGKRDGARTYHRAIDRYSWMEIVESVADVVIENTNIAFGLAVLQNAHEEIGKIKALKPESFMQEEPRLLNLASSMMGKLPISEVDLMIVDEMGKNISGTGMDTNITGRKTGSSMQVVHLFVRDLTPATHGNAQGIGLADFTTRKLVDKIDYDALYINSQTAYRTDTCKIPMTFDSDFDVLKTAITMAGVEDPRQFKIVWIRNTLELSHIVFSESYLNSIEAQTDLSILKGPFEIQFDASNNLISPLQHESGA